jgi:RNA polymerase sigma-70 factor (ECF subfamily)
VGIVRSQDDEASLAALLGRVAQVQDQEAFAQLFLHYAPRIKGYMRRQGADDAMAEDIAQDAMLTLWRKAGLYDPGKATVAAWIFAIARNLRIDRLRRERPQDVGEVEWDGIADESVLEDSLQQRETRRIVRDVMADLPPDQADVVSQSFFEDRPHVEIAERLGIPLGTVKSRLRLAMKRIRSAFGESE